jgi:peptidoglycan/xylan/chitin deacetylase (PgdA/CDA1 family)
MQPANFLAGLVPLPLLQRIVARDVTNVFYHAFADGPIPYVSSLFGCESPLDIEQNLIYLKTHFQIVSHDDIVAHRENGRKLPSRAAAVSLDDGFAECFSVARPLLLKHRVPATFFVCTGFIDNFSLMHRNKIALCLSLVSLATPAEAARLAATAQARFGFAAGSVADLLKWLRGLDYGDHDIIDAACECLGIDVTAFLRERRPYMTREQIAQLHAEGLTIGAHSSDHPLLGELPSWDDVRRQIRDSCQAVQEITGRERVPFAFPFNGLDLPRGALKALREELGGIYLIDNTNNLMSDRAFIVNRIWCDTPRGSSTGRSNLPMLLWQAHAFEPLRAIKRRLRGLPR